MFIPRWLVIHVRYCGGGWEAFSNNIWFLARYATLGALVNRYCGSCQRSRGSQYGSFFSSCMSQGWGKQLPIISVTDQIFLMFPLFTHAESDLKLDFYIPWYREYMVMFSKYIVIIIWKICFLTKVNENWPGNKRVVVWD